MTITFQVDKYLPPAIEKRIYEPVVLAQGPDGQRHRRLPGRDDRGRPDQGGLAQPLREQPRPAAVAVS